MGLAELPVCWTCRKAYPQQGNLRQKTISAPCRQHYLSSPKNSCFKIGESCKAGDGISYGFPVAFPFLLFLVVIVIYYLWVGMRGFTLPTFEPSLDSWL